jgi:hypothetical protein
LIFYVISIYLVISGISGVLWYGYNGREVRNSPGKVVEKRCFHYSPMDSKQLSRKEVVYLQTTIILSKYGSVEIL